MCICGCLYKRSLYDLCISRLCQTLALSPSLSRYLSLSVSVRASICRPVSLMTRSLLLSLVPSFFSTSSLARMRALVCACVFFVVSLSGVRR